jgi:hypothetical protein
MASFVQEHTDCTILAQNWSDAQRSEDSSSPSFPASTCSSSLGLPSSQLHDEALPSDLQALYAAQMAKGALRGEFHVPVRLEAQVLVGGHISSQVRPSFNHCAHPPPTPACRLAKLFMFFRIHWKKLYCFMNTSYPLSKRIQLSHAYGQGG